MRREATAYQWTCDRSHPHEGPHHALHLGAAVEGNHIDDADNLYSVQLLWVLEITWTWTYSSSKYASGPDSRDGPPDDECN